ncbi:hypothetical protein B0H13DRAFT_2652373 [Mycena leptocephala]|nr:hypothetical protein B0H13DRAFT_2652373 [Mycena leptocephala]
MPLPSPTDDPLLLVSTSGSKRKRSERRMGCGSGINNGDAEMREAAPPTRISFDCASAGLNVHDGNDKSDSSDLGAL